MCRRRHTVGFFGLAQAILYSLIDPHHELCPVNFQNEVSGTPMRAQTLCVGS